MTTYTYEYSRDYHPPAPFVEIVLNNDDEDATPLTLPAQVDTGSDATAIPIRWLRQVHAQHEDTRLMRGLSGFTQPVDLYAVAIQLAGETFYRDVIALRQGEEAIIGRDILNQFTITLNAPASLTEIVIF